MYTTAQMSQKNMLKENSREKRENTHTGTHSNNKMQTALGNNSPVAA